MSDKTEKLEQLRELVDKFRNNISQFTDKSYKEKQLRQDFIDEFFKLLDWDISNKECAIEEFRDVVIEDNLEISGTQKYPDYTFRIGNEPVFFVETKKPSVDIKGAIDPAHQVRRYGYTAKRKISILTDFHEFAIYDTRIKPGKNDRASVARLFYCTYDEFEKNWDFLYDLLSKEAVKKGSINNYVGKGTKKGTSEVDKDFLKLIEDWRSELAKNIAKNNKKTEIDAINMAVQKVIDRIIFLRICEEKGIEQFENLHTIGGNKAVYEKLVNYFDKANKKYNSELFKSDSFINELNIDDEILRAIIKGLYYPECPYAFSVLPVEILGNIYEQFLGKTIHLTETHQARIEEKPEARKAGGVYYTPKYIVDYIVKVTVGEKIKGLTPKEIEKIKILDPACGSGSFLLGAYTYLLNYHLVYYTQKENQAKALRNDVIYSSKENSYKLTIKEKQNILLNNIFGVDIDAQAVEVTKLSLMLKLLEGEGDESAGKLFKYSDTKLLPTLSGNIKCGNSLINSDFYRDKNLSLFGNEDMKRINAFDWQKEFLEILKAGGFDCVIGNPPYVRQESILEYKSYFERHYRVYSSIADLYAYFIEQGIHLLKKGGLFSYIVTNKWMRAKYGLMLRDYLKINGLMEIIDFGDLPVFKSVTTYPCIIKVKKDCKQKAIVAVNVKSLDFASLSDYVSDHRFLINSTDLRIDGWVLADTKTTLLLDKLKKSGIPLGEYVGKKVYYGIKTGLNEAFVINNDIKSRLIKENPNSNQIIKPFVAGRDIKRYENLKTDKYLILIPNGWTNENRGKINAESYFYKAYPAVSKYLRQFEDKAKARYDKGDYWWELRKCDYYDVFRKPKFLLPDISLRGNFAFDPTGGIYCLNTAYIIVSEDKYLLGILNSRLMTFFYKHLSAVFSGGYLRFIYQYLIQLPIVDIPKTDKLRNRMESLVEQMIHAKKTKNQEKVDIIDQQIDELVYRLFRLTKEEERVVEGDISIKPDVFKTELSTLLNN